MVEKMKVTKSLKKLKEKLYDDNILKFVGGRASDVITTAIGVSAWGVEQEANQLVRGAIIKYGTIGGLAISELRFLPLLLGYYLVRNSSFPSMIKKIKNKLDYYWSSLIEGIGVTSACMAAKNASQILYFQLLDKGYDISPILLSIGYLGITILLGREYMKKYLYKALRK